jgi:hypothetical protein
LGANFGNNFLMKGSDEMEERNLRKRLLAFFSFLLVFIAYVVQHLKDDANTNLKDGKELRV